MSHEIVNGSTMFSVRETPWHGLGIVVEQAPNAAEAIRLAGLDWEVELNRLQMADGRKVDANAVVRKTDGRVLADHVGLGYTPLQNRDSFAWFNPFVEAGECTYETAGSLRGGSRVWILAQLSRQPVEIADGDMVRKFLLLSNSHDGSLAVRVGFTPIRVVCANTLAMAHSKEKGSGNALIRLKHTKGLHVALADIRDIVNTANQRFEATAEQYRKLAKSKIANRKDLDQYIIRSLALPVDDKGKLSTRSQNILQEVINRGVNGYGSGNPAIRGTYWAAYNAVTEYLSYDRVGGNDRRLDSLWFGSAAETNQIALATALEMAQAV